MTVRFYLSGLGLGVLILVLSCGSVHAEVQQDFSVFFTAEELKRNPDIASHSPGSEDVRKPALPKIQAHDVRNYFNKAETMELRDEVFTPRNFKAVNAVVVAHQNQPGFARIDTPNNFFMETRDAFGGGPQIKNSSNDFKTFEGPTKLPGLPRIADAIRTVPVSRSTPGGGAD